MFKPTQKQLKNTLKSINNIKPYKCNLFNKTITNKLKKCKIKATCQNCLHRNKEV